MDHPAQIRRTLTAIAFLTGSACSPSTPPGDAGPGIDVGPDRGADTARAVRALVIPEAWMAGRVVDDPFGDLTGSPNCDRGRGWDVEEFDLQTTLGVDTNFCDFFTGTQPSRAPIGAGDIITVRMWHFALVGEGGAHFGIAIDGEVLWDERVDIPTESGQLYVEEVAAPRSFDEGVPVVFHLHNHGTNTYNLIEVNVGFEIE